MGTLRFESVCKVSAKVSADCFIKNMRKQREMIKMGLSVPRPLRVDIEYLRTSCSHRLFFARFL